MISDDLRHDINNKWAVIIGTLDILSKTALETKLCREATKAAWELKQIIDEQIIKKGDTNGTQSSPA